MTPFERFLLQQEETLIRSFLDPHVPGLPALLGCVASVNPAASDPTPEAAPDPAPEPEPTPEEVLTPEELDRARVVIELIGRRVYTDEG